MMSEVENNAISLLRFDENFAFFLFFLLQFTKLLFSFFLNVGRCFFMYKFRLKW